MTLKHLLTHTSGFCYDTWDGDMFKYASQAGGSGPAGAVTPLMFEPGTRWQYGTGVDWAGRLVEAVSGMDLERYFQAKILGPLDMRDTSFLVPESKFERLVSSWQRQPDGSLTSRMLAHFLGLLKSSTAEAALYSTAGDYVRFMQMILEKGRGATKARILEPKTVADMEINQIGNLTAGKMKSYRQNLSSDVDIQPGFTEKWGLGFLINTTAYPEGRSANLAWAADRQHVLLDRSEAFGLCGADDAVPALCGQGGGGPSGRLRTGCVQDAYDSKLIRRSFR